MPTPPDADLVNFAVDLTRQAGEHTLKWFRAHELEVYTKGDGSPVTEADREAEHLIRDAITARYPQDSIYGEEHGRVVGTSGRRWIIDPIDGTRAFTRGVALYSNLLCVEEDGEALVAVVNMPALDECVWAGRGLGCFFNGHPTGVSDHPSLTGACLTSSGFDHWETRHLNAVHTTDMHLRTWGDGYGYALVATGRAEAMVDPEVSEWDIAPMGLLLAEAGGRFSSLDGREGATHGSGLGTNGHLHEPLLALFADA